MSENDQELLNELVRIYSEASQKRHKTRNAVLDYRAGLPVLQSLETAASDAYRECDQAERSLLEQVTKMLSQEAPMSQEAS